jgi:hypothetical protein
MMSLPYSTQVDPRPSTVCSEHTPGQKYKWISIAVPRTAILANGPNLTDMLCSVYYNHFPFYIDHSRMYQWMYYQLTIVMAQSSSQLAANVYLPICLCISVCTYLCLCLLIFAICLCTSVCTYVFLCLLMLLMYAYVCLSVCLWVMTSVKEFSVGTMKHGRKGSV